MYRDNTLIPSEAIRLLALGILDTGDQRYGALAAEVRHFTTHIAGPSLDLVASPIEVLIVEGLVEAIVSEDEEDDALLRITESGREKLIALLNTNVRAPINDINKLIISLKMRFLHLLPAKDQQLQTEMLVEMCERELARLVQLREHHSHERGHLVDWLDHDIAAIRERLTWFQGLSQRLGA